MMQLGLVLHLFLLLSTTTAKIGYFWHITDIHLDVHYSTAGDTNKHCRRSENKIGVGVAGRRLAGKFGDHNCDSPWALVESAAKAMKSKHGDNIEFVLWTGDGVAHFAEISAEHQMAVLQNLTDLLKHTFSSQFVFPVLGHDDPNPGLDFGTGYKSVGNMWKNWLPPEAIQTFNKGGYYTIEQKSMKLRIIALNTNLCSDIVGVVEEDPSGQWQWLEEQLGKSQRNKDTVYLVGHMPPGVDERQNGGTWLFQDIFQDKFNQRYLKLVRKYSDIIVGQFFGHLHSDSFRIVYNEDGTPVSWIFIAPAVSPKRTASGANNPGLRLYKFDTDTGQVLDYQQYYLDLTAANQRGIAEWQTEYNLSDYYGLREVSAQELHRLVENFAAPDGTSLFSRYYRANSVRMHQSTSTCDASCAHTHYCAIKGLDYEDFRSCLDTAPSALSSGGKSVKLLHHYFVCSFLLLSLVATMQVLKPTLGVLCNS